MKTREIAEFLSGELRGDGDVEITSVADLESAHEGQIAFFDKPTDAPSTGASCLLVRTDAASICSTSIAVSNPKLAFCKIAEKLSTRQRLNGRDHTARIAETAEVRASYIGAQVTIGDGCEIADASEIHSGVSIGQNVRIGSRTIIYPNCVIYDNVQVGDNCILHAGVVVGADGFGYVADDDGERRKFPQIGTVVIEDNVEIGANTCIDRGALGETRIGAGTKIDNLVQIAHNVQIGKRVVIAAQTGISGSVTIEDDCVIGGQVGFGDHVRVLRGAVIGSQAGVLPGKIVRPGVWWGTPIQPLDEYKRQNAHVKGLARLREEVKGLRTRVEKLFDR